MTQAVILDASALLAVAKQEPGAEKVVQAMRSASGNAYIHAINVFEVAYKLMSLSFSESAAWEISTMNGLVKIDDAGDFVGRRAARLKIASPFLSLGDCFALALAESLSGCVITGDRDFARVRTDAVVSLIR